MITKEQAERLITLIDTMIDVKTDLATATEESATWSLEEREAAAARWKSKILRATHRGNFLDDFGIDAECYVLDDESKTVVVTKTGLSQLLGIGEHARDLDQLLSAQYMSKYRDLELQRKMENPYKFQLTSKSKTVHRLYDTPIKFTCTRG